MTEHACDFPQSLSPFPQPAVELKDATKERLKKEPFFLPNAYPDLEFEYWRFQRAGTREDELLAVDELDSWPWLRFCMFCVTDDRRSRECAERISAFYYKPKDTGRVTWGEYREILTLAIQWCAEEAGKECENNELPLPWGKGGDCVPRTAQDHETVERYYRDMGDKVRKAKLPPEALVNGADGANTEPIEEDAKPRITWQEAAKSLLFELERHAEPRSMDAWGEVVGCAKSTVSKAMEKMPALRSLLLNQERQPHAQSINDVVADSAQAAGTDPADAAAERIDDAEQIKVDEALKRLMNKAAPQEQEKLNALPRSKLNELGRQLLDQEADERTRRDGTTRLLNRRP